MTGDYMRVLVLLVLGLVAGVPAAQNAIPAQRDVAVYREVLAAKVRTEVDRFSAGAGLSTPAPVLAFDRTMAICNTPPDHPKPMGCMDEESVVQAFERQLPRMQAVLFEGLLSADSRRELGASFRQRNSTSQPFPAAHLARVITASPENLDETRKRESRRTIGISGFSLPAYSSDGHAIVYGSYVCGGLCGYGWLFLLKEQGESWEVIKTHMLWIS